MNNKTLHSYIQTISAIIATTFGLITIWVGGMTLFDFFDPGYVIFVPLLIYNTVMGFFYTATGVVIWQQHPKALQASKFIFVLNILVLIIITLLYLTNFEVAFNSLKAMSFRTLVWGVIYFSLTKTGY